MKHKAKVCLYLQYPKSFEGSGIHRSVKYKQEALRLNKVDYTPNIEDKHNILHVNSVLPGIVRKIKKSIKEGKKIVIQANTTVEDTVDTFWYGNLFPRITKWWLTKVYSSADLIICPSSYTTNLLKTKYKGLENKNIISISSGIDTKKWNFNKNKAEEFKRIYNLKSPIILGVGLVFPRKGIIDFIKTAREVPEANFVWIGKELNGRVMSKELNRELKNRPKNFLLTGYVKDIIGAYSAADVFFFPSKEENEGIVVLEAATMKKPILVRDIPVFRSYLNEGKDCLMGKTNKEFAQKIRNILKDSKLRVRLADNAKKMAEDRSLKKIGKQLKEAYQSLLK
jgi:1,2-diacylglycerol-3-alpha-glucose alpha-1,2-glucosyltransferase